MERGGSISPYPDNDNDNEDDFNDDIEENNDEEISKIRTRLMERKRKYLDSSLKRKRKVWNDLCLVWKGSSLEIKRKDLEKDNISTFWMKAENNKCYDDISVYSVEVLSKDQKLQCKR